MRVVCAFVIVLGAVATLAAQARVPSNWRRFETPAAQESREVACSMHARALWRVSFSGPDLNASMVDRTRRRDAVPYEIDFSEVINPTIDQEWRTRYGREQARRIVTQVSDGWLIGFQAGENGGSLWWYPSKPGQGRKLYDQNVLAILDGSDPSNKLILSGLAHLSSNVGVALWVGRDGSGNWGILHQADLRGEPSAHAKHSRGWVIAHTKGVDLILPDGTVEVAATSSQWLAIPESIAVGPLGEIAIGRQLFVNLFRPADSGYREEIYIPAACARFRDDGLTCECAGGV